MIPVKGEKVKKASLRNYLRGVIFMKKYFSWS